MNPVVTLTPQKANARVRRGSAFGYLGQRNFASKSCASKPCQWFFSIPEGSSIKTLYQLGKRLMLTFIKMFWIVSSKALTAFVPICARLEIGFFSMTTHQPTMRHQFASFWQKKYYSPSSPFLFATMALANYFLFPKLKLQLKGRRFEDI